MIPVNWNSAAEANAALDRGELPHGYAIRADGALIVPPHVGGNHIRGSSSIAARFDEIVTTDGRVLKSKSGDPA